MIASVDGQIAHGLPTDPDVSVIIPTYRRVPELVRAIRSVLDQDLTSLEVVVVDDSPERSAQAAVGAIGDGRVRYETMNEVSHGRPALVRNVGMSVARGHYLYFLDDDDTMLPGALARLVQALDDHPKKGVAYGRVECIGPDAAIRERYERWWGRAAEISRRVRFSSWITAGVIMFRCTLIINSCCAIRREVALRLRGYDPDLAVYEDVDFFTRGIRQFGHVFVDVPVLCYSTGRSSIIHDLHGDTEPIHRSYTLMHRNYKRRHGVLDYRLLQLASKAIPL
jgi:glycosyltransferase involved in cell wall biosynthesis